jgi:hypothetical protein
VVVSFRVGVMPGGEGSELPTRPFQDLTLDIDALTNSIFLKQPAREPKPAAFRKGDALVTTTFDFELSVPPGTYNAAVVELAAPELAHGLITIPMSMLQFNIPRVDCIYAGLVTASYYRLPDGSLEEQKRALKELTEAVELDPLHEDVYIPTDGGGLVPEFDSMRVELPPPDQRPSGSTECQVAPASFPLLGG